MKALERLEQQLDEKDDRIESLERELEELKNDAEADWKWSRHKTLKENADNLPVPRLEIRWVKESEDGYLTRWDYWLIRRHLCDHLVAVPLGETKSQGGNGLPPIYEGKIQTPFRDGVHICHDSEHLGIPAFGICGSLIVRLTMKDGKCAQEVYLPNRTPSFPTRKEPTMPAKPPAKRSETRLVKRWTRLLTGQIVGIVDAYGAVHSVFTGEQLDAHADHFPPAHCQWRWSHRDSINWFVSERKPSEEQFEAIQRHLTKRFGLLWWENGHHDIDHLQKKCAQEKSALNATGQPIAVGLTPTNGATDSAAPTC